MFAGGTRGTRLAALDTYLPNSEGRKQAVFGRNDLMSLADPAIRPLPTDIKLTCFWNMSSKALPT